MLRVYTIRMSSSIPVTVLAFGSAAEALGGARVAVTVGGAGRLADLIEALERNCPRLAAARGRLRFAVNQRYADAGAALRPGDEVAIIPPVSGG